MSKVQSIQSGRPSYDTWSNISVSGSSQGSYKTLKTITYPANSKYIIYAWGGNAQGTAIANNIDMSVTSGTPVFFHGSGVRSQDTGGNVANGLWAIVTGTTAVTVIIRTYIYNTAVTNFNGGYINIPIV